MLIGILLENYYQHHLLLVESTYLLLQRCISEEDINHTFQLLKHYCFMFAVLYGTYVHAYIHTYVDYNNYVSNFVTTHIYIGEQHMTINIHNLLHLPDSYCKTIGPLWTHSCFPFQNASGESLKLFHGSQAVEKQVSIYFNFVAKPLICG